MPLKTSPFDVAEHLSTLEDQNDLIADAVETGDPTFIRHTLNTVARARGMTQIAREAGVTREALYKALGPDGDPRMSTLLGVFNSLGVKLSVEPSHPSSKAQTLAATDEMMPVYEESLQVGKREVSHGRLRVRSDVVETAVNEQISLRTENVSVDRVPVDRAISVIDVLQDHVIEVEEFAEEAVVSKQVHLVEEISLHKEARDRTETITDMLRDMEVEIEDGRGTVVGGSATQSGIVEGSNAGLVLAHMDVIASDGTKVGTVDHMDGADTIKLAKITSTGGEHHYIPMAWVDYVDQQVHLGRSSAEIETDWHVPPE